MKLLGEDERRMYLEIRDRGGAVLQRDLVSMGTFSKAKVTRVLDKLERRGLVVRERHGMTNRVRLVGPVGK
ncbi:MAG: helix-turn-helix transcriptional regulator [Methanobacteriota archaeon]